LKETEFHPALKEFLQISNIEGENVEALLLSFLREKVGKLLAGDTEKLWQILYRLDVSEEKVRDLFRSMPASNWTNGIADLILEREKERQYWRNRYKGESNAPRND